MREFPDSADVLFKGSGDGKPALSDALVPL